MSNIQIICALILLVIIAVVNIIGWLFLHKTDKDSFTYNDPERTLLFFLIVVDGIVVLALILGALGVFG